MGKDRVPTSKDSDWPWWMPKEIRPHISARMAMGKPSLDGGPEFVRVSLTEARQLVGDCSYCQEHIAYAKSRGAKAIWYNREDFHVNNELEMKARKEGRHLSKDEMKEIARRGRSLRR